VEKPQTWWSTSRRQSKFILEYHHSSYRITPTPGSAVCGQAELSRLKPGRIVVLGGSNAVSERVAQELHLSLPR
jgi:hypothetical protein